MLACGRPMDKERGENRWFKKVYKEGFAKANIQIVLTDLSRYAIFDLEKRKALVQISHLFWGLNIKQFCKILMDSVLTRRYGFVSHMYVYFDFWIRD